MELQQWSCNNGAGAMEQRATSSKSVFGMGSEEQQWSYSNGAAAVELEQWSSEQRVPRAFSEGFQMTSKSTCKYGFRGLRSKVSEDF